MDGTEDFVIGYSRVIIYVLILAKGPNTLKGEIELMHHIGAGSTLTLGEALLWIESILT
jgi:hypothetical protein